MTQKVVLLALVVLLSVTALGQVPTAPIREKVTPQKLEPIKPDDIKITLNSSRTQINSDTSFAISAGIENNSSRAIYITPTFLTLTIPPEVDPAYNGGGGSEWLAFLPGTGNSIDSNKVVAVQPGSRTVAVFSLRNNPSGWQRFRTALRLLPGDYAIHVVCAYWDNLEDAKQQSLNYATQVAETKVPFLVPPIAILPGAALGGLLAFLLFPSLWLPPTKKFNEHRRLEKLWIVVTGLGVSCLLSVIVTILLSRISESQFLVKVSVQDTWGAVAIGFIAGVSGTSVLQRFNLSQAEKLDKARGRRDDAGRGSKLPAVTETAEPLGTSSSTSARRTAA